MDLNFLLDKYIIGIRYKFRNFDYFFIKWFFIKVRLYNNRYKDIDVWKKLGFGILLVKNVYYIVYKIVKMCIKLYKKVKMCL